MTLSVGVGGSWKDSPAQWVGVGGVWKAVDGQWVGVGGVWKQFFSADEVHTFIGPDAGSINAPVGFAYVEITGYGASAKGMDGFDDSGDSYNGDAGGSGAKVVVNWPINPGDSLGYVIGDGTSDSGPVDTHVHGIGIAGHEVDLLAGSGGNTTNPRIYMRGLGSASIDFSPDPGAAITNGNNGATGFVLNGGVVSPGGAGLDSQANGGDGGNAAQTIPGTAGGPGKIVFRFHN